MLVPADDNGMPTQCRIYSSDADARAAVADLLAAGHAGADIRVLMGSHNHDDAPEGAFAGCPACRARSRAKAAPRARTAVTSSRAAAGSARSTARPSRATRTVSPTSASLPTAT